MPGQRVTGIDLNAEWLAFARHHDARSTYLQANALALPFADNSFDQVLSVVALCFAIDWQKAVSEIVRVARKRFAIGMLNRNSLPWGGLMVLRGDLKSVGDCATLRVSY